ncbi:Ptr2p [Ascoidea rubescens DSM 1968]|uniref:PTR2-domain-containing protein n=1 Tax=Ascoidea rubescens DSM 1968 TaxID=1344418 RepID=A0A1D2VKE1_9ASCO|nr:PTR2-domain-containing protein [Ascoidea rubescens DSM 1968]ODV61997.1 PTR2-domain-containing protein [Ascoidea rubescens DSM 1968]
MPETNINKLPTNPNLDNNLQNQGKVRLVDSEVNSTDICEIENQPLPTEEEEKTLQRVCETIPWACWLVAIVELCERFAYYGLSGPFMNYMQYKPDDRIPGALGLGQKKSNALSYFFQFWCYVCPVFGAWISDTYLGKYKAICWFTGIYTIGILVLFLTSLPVSIENNVSFGGFIAAIIIIGLGTGGVKANVSPLIADQIPTFTSYVKTNKKGERVIVDPAVTYQTVFMVFYLCINVGSLSSIATTTLEKEVGFWAAYLLPFCFFFVGVGALIIGQNIYIKTPPSKTIIGNSFRISFITLLNRGKFEAAKPSFHPEKSYPWTDLFVEEVRRALLACQVFVFFIVYWVVYGQMLNNFVSQAGQMELHGIPNDIMQNIDPLTIIIFIPICERLFYPFLRKIGIKFKPITRIFWGFMMGSVAMAYAAIVQKLIYNAGPCYEHPLECAASDDGNIPNHIHVAVQSPAYFFIAMSEIFASITGLEYAYTKAPPQMKSFVMSLFLLTSAGGSALGIALSPTAEDPKLVWTYTGLCVACFITGIMFYFCFRKLNDMEEDLNRLDFEEKLQAQEKSLEDEKDIEKVAKA